MEGKFSVTPGRRRRQCRAPLPYPRAALSKDAAAQYHWPQYGDGRTMDKRLFDQ